MENIVEITDHKNKIEFKNFKLVNSYYTFDIYFNNLYSNELCLNVDSLKKISNFISSVKEDSSGDLIMIRDYDSPSILLLLNHNERFIFIFNLTYPESKDYMIVLKHRDTSNIVKQINDLVVLS